MPACNITVITGVVPTAHRPGGRAMESSALPAHPLQGQCAPSAEDGPPGLLPSQDATTLLQEDSAPLDPWLAAFPSPRKCTLTHPWSRVSSLHAQRAACPGSAGPPARRRAPQAQEGQLTTSSKHESRHRVLANREHHRAWRWVRETE